MEGITRTFSTIFEDALVAPDPGDGEGF